MSNRHVFLTSIGFVVVGRQEFFGVMEAIRSGLAVIQVRRGDLFGVVVGVFAGGESVLFDESVVGSAGQGEVVDVGAVGGLPALDVVDLAVVGGGVASRFGAATVLGMTVPVVRPRQTDARSAGSAQVMPPRAQALTARGMSFV
jgi:hypothetical protein